MIQIDMDMPERCGQCRLFCAENPMHCMATIGFKCVGAPYGMPRPDWCPLKEIKHGRWIDTGKTELNLEDDAELRIFQCSECGTQVTAEKYPHETAFYLTKFCSECGARMDG